jgi:hypothetical protein
MINRLIKAFNPWPVGQSTMDNIELGSGWGQTSQQMPIAVNDSQGASGLAWAGALQAHLDRCRRAQASQSLPKAFSAFKVQHAMVAELLWQERQQMHHRLIHMHTARGELLCVVNPRSHQVLIKRSLETSLRQPISWRAMPSTASSLEGITRDGFDTITVDQLLWFCGQTQGFAASSLPEPISTAPLSLRRFPAIPPECLQLRHFTLIQLLSEGPRRFDQLLQDIDEEDMPALCGDIASFVMCRALMPV